MEPEPHEVEWRSVVGYEGLYEVSEFGDVRRLGGTPGCKQTRVLVPCISGGPVHRLQVTLCRGGSKRYVHIHKLVAFAFLGPQVISHKGKGAIQIDHIDGNWFNNRRSNLEYVTVQENAKRAVALKLKAKGEQVGSAAVTEAIVREIRAMPAHQWIIAKVFGISQTAVSRIKRRTTWRHVADAP